MTSNIRHHPGTISAVNSMRQELDQAVERWDDLGWPRPDVALVSGSGLTVDLGDPEGRENALADWLPFETHQIEGHPLKVQLLTAGSGRQVLYLKGRLHSYQGYDAHQTVFTVRLAATLGARTLIMTNAAGGLRGDQRPGDLTLIRDQINLTGLNPLRGELPSEWGPRFPDMTEPYSERLRALALGSAMELGFTLGQGTYAAVAGPSYETPAEVAMLRRSGADMVGMSTALEIIAARHMGVECLALSVITNLAPGVGSGGVSHEEVLQEGREASGRLRSLLTALLANPRLTATDRRP
jgi:purine-nucleoside phosphorylase